MAPAASQPCLCCPSPRYKLSLALNRSKGLLCVLFSQPGSRMHRTPPDDLLAVSRAIFPSLCLGPAIILPRPSANSWISHVFSFSISPTSLRRDYKSACHWNVAIKVSAPTFLLRYLSKVPKHLTLSTKLPILLPTKPNITAGTSVNCLPVGVKFQAFTYIAVHVRKESSGDEACLLLTVWSNHGLSYLGPFSSYT